MRLAVLLLSAVASLAIAQETPPLEPTPPPQGAAASQPGLQDLNATLNDLQDAAETPSPDEAPPPDEAPDQAAPATPDQTEPEAPGTPDEGAASGESEAAPETGQAPPTGEPVEQAVTTGDRESGRPREARPPVLPPYLRHPGAELEPAQQTQIARAVARGRQMIAIARAGLVATQDMLAHVANPDGAGIAGWIAEPQGNAMLVTFYSGDSAETRKAVYRVSILGARAVSRSTFLDPAERPGLTPAQERLAAAREATNALDHQPCAGGVFNVLVIPTETPDGPIDVYQMTPAAQRRHYPLGGHYRATVNPDGTVAEVQSFLPCADIVAPDTQPGAAPQPIRVTGGEDVLPDEIHVFLALWTGHPLIVESGGRTWRVTGESITEAQ